MGKLAVFGITFAKSRNVFFPGDFITGQLVIHLNETMKMKVIRISFRGNAHVNWTETHSTGSGVNQRTETRHFSASENLFNQTIIVHGEGSNEEKSLPEGQHVFPFKYQLPAPLPSSYEDHVGYIIYSVKGTIVKPWKFDHNTTHAFTVLDTLDLNTIPAIMTPSGAAGTKSLCCWCCASGPIEVDFHADRSGYVPGEFILISATITNSSNSKVKSTSVQLMQTVTYHATSKSRIDSKIVNTITGPPVGKHGSANWTNEKLQIPPLPPSESTHCRIIDIAYSVVFQAHLRTCAVDLRLTAPITIGTIPIRSLEMYRNQPIGFLPLPTASTTIIDNASAPPLPTISASLAPTASLEPTPHNNQPPPPTYAAATDGGCFIKDEDDGGHTTGNTTYAPQYTYYDWSQSAFSYNK